MRNLFVTTAVVALAWLSPLVRGQGCTAWSDRGVTGPAFRSSHAMAFDAARGRAVIVGGFSLVVGQNELLADTWEFDGTTWVQRATGGITPCQNPVAVYDSFRNKTVMFGGLGFNLVPTYQRETYEWNGSAWVNRELYGPAGRYLHAMAYDAARRQVVMFGGITSAGSRDSDTWVFDGSAWTRVATTGPAPRYGHSMAYDPIRQRVVLFGGFGGSTAKQALADTWVWDGTSWQLAASVGPTPRFFHAMAHDASRGVVTLVGGRSQAGEELSDVWEWSGSSWTSAGTDSLGPREQFTMAFDSVRGRLITFGGWGPRGRYGDSWERVASGNAPVLTLQPPDRISPEGTSTTFRVDVSGTGPFQFQWRRGGVALADNARYSGTRGAVFRITGITQVDSDAFDCVVSNSCGSQTSRRAWLLVRCPADVDNGAGIGVPDQSIDVEDLSFFMTALETGDVRADVDDGSGTGTLDHSVDFADILYFLVHFESGC